jgi:hypothetical protein
LRKKGLGSEKINQGSIIPTKILISENFSEKIIKNWNSTYFSGKPIKYSAIF